MNIDTISKDKIKICLTNDEINSLFGGYDMIDYERPRSKMVLNTLLSSALPEESLPLDCKKMLIEVRPIYGGCSILFTRISERSKRLHKVKKGKTVTMIFKSDADMLSFAKAFGKRVVSSRLFLFENRYILRIMLDSEEKIDILHLKEYGEVLDEKSVAASYIAEHGKVLFDGALKKIEALF